MLLQACPDTSDGELDQAPCSNLQGVASRDIKLENTLLDSSPRPLVKICDFGYSKHEKFQSAPGSRVGTPAYLAPEVIMTKQGSTYDGKVDLLYSCNGLARQWASHGKIMSPASKSEMDEGAWT